MKAVLINPPTEKLVELGGCHSTINNLIGFYPPLGIMYVAAYLEKYSHHEVEILDAPVEGITCKAIETEIRRRKPDIVGITVTTHTLIAALETARIAKEVDHHIHVCLGGPHVNLYPYETIKFQQVDSLILGEGEIAFTELVTSLETGKQLNDLKGLLFKENGRIHETGLRGPISDLDAMPFPARHLIHFEKYRCVLGKKRTMTTMMTSRGCPYSCAFCYRSFGRKLRTRSAKNVVDEMEECLDLGIKEFFMFDDNFTTQKKRVIAICDEILTRKLDITWAIRARVNEINEEILKKLKEAGCERIQCGVETGTDEMLKTISKGTTIEQVKKAFKLIKKFGFTSYADFMIGLPTETEEHILKTIRFTKEIDPDYVQISIFTPLPSTEFYQMGLEKEIISHDYWREFATNPTEKFEMGVWEENMSKSELIKLQKFAYKEFYLRTSKLLSMLMKTTSFAEFQMKFMAGIDLLRTSK